MKTALAAKVANFFSNDFWFWLDKRIGVKFGNRETDKFFDTIYRVYLETSSYCLLSISSV